MKQNLQFKATQHLSLTPQLQQSIKLLQMSSVELNQELEILIQQNPKRADWWVKMEIHVGARFSKDKPTYKQMANFNRNQSSLFVDETISCFCGD